MNENGFTLIEIIVGITLIGIAAALLATSGIPLINSTAPLNTIADNYAVARAIEIVNADYRYRLSNDSSADDDVMSDYESYEDDLSGAISDLSDLSVSVTGKETSFSTPDASGNVTEDGSGTIKYFLITAQKNNSRMVTLIGN